MATITKIVEISLEVDNPVVMLAEILIEDMKLRLPIADEDYDSMKDIITCIGGLTNLTLDTAGKVLGVTDGFAFKDGVETLMNQGISKDAAERMLQCCMKHIFGVLKTGAEDLIEDGDESQTKPILKSESVE